MFSQDLMVQPIDPDRPKKVTSSFFFFSQDQRKVRSPRL